MRRNGKKERKSFSLSPENAEWLDTHHPDNKSAFVDKLLESARGGASRADIAGLRARLEMAKERRQHHLERAEEFAEEIEELEEQLDKLQGEKSEELENALDSLEEPITRWKQQGKDPVENAAVERYARDLGMTPEALVDVYEENRKDTEPKSELRTAGRT